MSFIENKYSKWYWGIVVNAKGRILGTDVYVEKHHIIPRCMGGGEGDNVVALTAKEHFICHLLLPKFVEKKYIHKLSYAAWQMTIINKRPRYRVTSRIYGLLKKQLSESMRGKVFSDEHKRKIGLKSRGRKPMLGKKLSEETKRKISESKIGIPRPKTAETRKKMSDTWKKISPDRAGEKNPMFGKKQKSETKELISKANSGSRNGMFGKYDNSPIICCPHCYKSGKEGPNFLRWHFDKCKEKDV